MVFYKITPKQRSAVFSSPRNAQCLPHAIHFSTRRVIWQAHSKTCDVMSLSLFDACLARVCLSPLRYFRRNEQSFFDQPGSREVQSRRTCPNGREPGDGHAYMGPDSQVSLLYGYACCSSMRATLFAPMAALAPQQPCEHIPYSRNIQA